MSLLDKKKKEESDLWNQYNKSGFKDEDALEKLLNSHGPILWKSVSKFSNPNIPKSAIKAEAMSLANKAYKSYNPNKGAQLGTHVHNYMMKLYRFTNNYANIGSIPEHRIGNLNAYNRELKNYKDLHGEFNEPSDDWMAKKLKIDKKEVIFLKNEIRKDLSSGVGDAEDLMGESFQVPDTLKETLGFIRLESDMITKDIIDYKFGLNNKPIMTDQEIMKKLNITNYQLKAKLKEVTDKLKGKI